MQQIAREDYFCPQEQPDEPQRRLAERLREIVGMDHQLEQEEEQG